MVDTVRTEAELLALFADNTSGNISPQDTRDLIATVFARSPVSTISSTMDAATASPANPLYMFGMYEAGAADANLTNAAATATHGDANSFHCTHAFAVIGGTPTTNGTTLTLTVTGVSINDLGVRNGIDSEVLFTGALSSLATNQYLETSKKWLGTVTYTLTSDGTVFTLDINHGSAKYNDFGNREFNLDGFEFEVNSVAATPGLEIEVIHHKSTGWTYSAAAFVPGPGATYKLTDDVSAADNLIGNDKKCFYKRASLTDLVHGDASEGLIVRITPDFVSDVGIISGNIFLKPTA